MFKIIEKSSIIEWGEHMKYIKEFLPYVVILMVVILLRSYIITPVQVDGKSMMPTLKDNEVLLLKKYDRDFDRFRIVVLDYEGERLIKRIIGLPGDHIAYRGNKLYINGTSAEENFTHEETYDFDIKDLGYDVIPKGHYLVLGDNRVNSLDGRIFGPVDKKQMRGIVDFSLFPFSSFGTIK